VLLPRVGPRALIASGMLLGLIGMLYLTRLTATSSYLSGVLPALLVMGLAFGLIFAPAINTATAGVRREDSGVASALVNTMQQVGGSIGTSALSTIALTETTSYLVAHHTGALAQATAAVHGYTLAFTVSAGLFVLGVILAIALLPSRHRLEELRNQAAAPTPVAAAAQPVHAPESVPVPAMAPALAGATEPAPAMHLEMHAIPVALLCCSPVINSNLKSPAAPIL
jgi:nitrate/nitrite transporter NarK